MSTVHPKTRRDAWSSEVTSNFSISFLLTVQGVRLAEMLPMHERKAVIPRGGTMLLSDLHGILNTLSAHRVSQVKLPITFLPPASYWTLIKSLSVGCHLLGSIPTVCTKANLPLSFCCGKTS